MRADPGQRHNTERQDRAADPHAARHPRWPTITRHTTGALRRRGDRGSLTLEVAVLAPALLVVISLVIVAGRLQVASGAVEQAAAAAARAASLARVPGPARQAATWVARSELDQRDLHCTHLVVSVDVTGFAVPVGQPAQVRARVECTVPLAGLGPVPGLPASRVIEAQAVSVLDRYRSRTTP